MSGSSPSSSQSEGWGRDWVPNPGWAAGHPAPDVVPAEDQPTQVDSPASADRYACHPAPPAEPPGGATAGTADPPAPATLSLTELLDTAVTALRRHLGPLVVATAPLAAAIAAAELLCWWLATTLLRRQSAPVRAVLGGTADRADVQALLTSLVWVGLAGLGLAVVTGGVRALVDGWIAAIVAGAGGLRAAADAVRPRAGRLLASGVFLTGLVMLSLVPALVLLGAFVSAGLLLALVALPFQLVLLAVILVRSSLMPAALLRAPGRVRGLWGPRLPVRFWTALGVLLLAAALATALGAVVSAPVQMVTAALTPTVEDPAELLDLAWWLGPHVPLAVLSHAVAVCAGYSAFSVISALLGLGRDFPGI